VPGWSLFFLPQRFRGEATIQAKIILIPDATILRSGPPDPYNFFACPVTLYPGGANIGPVETNGAQGVEDSRRSSLPLNGLLPLFVPLGGVLLWRGFRRNR